jgi:hypothetical protein
VTDDSDRLTGGITCAWLSVLFITFLTSCVYFQNQLHRSLRWTDASQIVSLGLVTVVFASPFVSAAALLLGLPIFRSMRRNRRDSVEAFLLAGFLISGVSAVAMSLLAYFGPGIFDLELHLALWVIVISGPVASLVVRHFLIGRSSSNPRLERP